MLNDNLYQYYPSNGLNTGIHEATQWVARLTRNVEVVGSSSIKGPRCFLDQETLPLLLSTGWFQGRFRAWFHNRTKNKSRALWKIDFNIK